MADTRQDPPAGPDEPLSRLARAAIERAPIGYIAVRLSDWRYIDANELVLRLDKLSRESFYERDWRDGFGWCDEAQKQHFLSTLLSQGVVHDAPADRLGPTGERVQITLTAVLVDHPVHGKCMAAFGRDVQAERELEAAHERSVQALQLLASHMRDAIYRIRLVPERRVEYISPAIGSISGHHPEEFYADFSLIERLVVPDRLPQLREIFEDRFDFSQPSLNEWIVKDGRRIWTEDLISPVRDGGGKLVAIEGVLREITERRRLEEQLRHSQKMEIVGLLAGGVAHDFNNLLVPILAQSELMFADMAQTDPRREEVRLIHDAAQRAAALVGQLLALSRKQPVTMQELNVNDVVRPLLTVLRWLAGERVTMHLSLGEGLGPVRADAAQLQQVLMNLVANARDAMPSGGELTLSTADVELDGSAAAVAGVAPGRFVALAVADTGQGMDAATTARIFEPFFTTKPVGKGSGLGLSVVYGIVQRHCGGITVDSRAGTGTRMTVLLPCVAPTLPVASTAAERSAHQRTVLVVDDEELVRNLVGRVLEKNGYRVLSAGSAHEAEHLARLAVKVDLLLTDVVMPQVGGRALHGRLQPTQPAMKVLFMSGYAADALEPEGSLPADAALLRKPFSVQTLLDAVRAALDEPAR